MTEQWKPISIATQYLVSSEGRIRHCKSERCRKTSQSAKGYVYVCFWTGNKLVSKTVHGLVAEAFLGPRPDGYEVCHNDGNRANNFLDNLRYGTKKDNARDRDLHGNTMRGERNGNSKLLDAKVAEIISLYEGGLATQYELAAMFGISQAQINNIVLRKQRRAA